MFKKADSILETDPDVLEAIQLVKTLVNYVGTQKREYADRVKRFEGVPGYELPDINLFKESPDVDPADLKAALEIAKDAIISALEKTNEQGAKSYIKKFEAVQNLRDLLTLHDLFIARADPEITREHKSDKKRAEQRKKIEENREYVEIFDKLDNDLASKFVKYYERGSWKSSRDVLGQGKMLLDLQARRVKSTASLEKIKSARKVVQNIVARLENKTMIKSADSIPEAKLFVKQLMLNSRPPNLDDIRPLIKILDIQSAEGLWELLEALGEQYRNKKFAK